MEFLWLFVGFLIGLLVAWFFLNARYRNQFEARQAELLQQVRDADERAEAERDVNRTTQIYTAELEANKTSTAERIAVLDEELTMIRNQRRLERAELDKVKQQQAEAEAARESAIVQAESLQSDLAAAGSELENARAAEADRAARFGTLEAANEELKAKLDEAAAENEASRARTNDLQENLGQRDETIRQLEEKLAASRSQAERPENAGSLTDDSQSGESHIGESHIGESMTGQSGTGAFAATEMPEPENSPAPDAAQLPDQPSPIQTADAQGDRADNLTKIKGIGKVLRGKLNQLGITTFRQIAEFTEADIERVNAELDFPGRIEREQWIEQARSLMSD